MLSEAIDSLSGDLMPTPCLFRRGGPPTPARAGDPGRHGPDSILWKVIDHPAVVAMEVPVTALLQFTHAGMSATFLQHDPLYLAAARGQATAPMVVSRHRRTFGVVVPAIFGDTASAERTTTHLRRFHRRMHGVIPGTDEPYDAMGEELVLYGHVTLMHAALLIYEHAGYDGPRPPHRLTDDERDRFWSEAAPFAVAMGARDADVPRSAADVRAYYASCEDRDFNWGLMLKASARVAAATVRPSQWREHPADAAIVLALAAAHLPAVGLIPRPARRHLGIPALADPLIDAAFRVTRPAYALLSIPPLGDAITAWMTGPENFELIQSARALRAELASTPTPTRRQVA
jgi:uncharacterized protein (DUF2236 family)